MAPQDDQCEFCDLPSPIPPSFSHFPYGLNVRKKGDLPISLGSGEGHPSGGRVQGRTWVAGENETDGGSRFSSQSMGVEAAIEPMARVSAQSVHS